MSDAMRDATIDLAARRFHHDLVAEIDGPDDDPVLEVTVNETVVIDADGARRGAPELVVRTGDGGIVLTDREQVLRLQAIVNRAANHWRELAGGLD